MKLSKMAGAFALTAALAMGTVPALAAETATGNMKDFSDGATWGSSNEAAATGDTVVRAFAFNEQLNATIPLEITVVFPSTGGAITAPDKTAYKIVNNSTKADIKVVEAELSGANTAFNWLAKDLTGGITMNTQATNNSKDQIIFKLQAGGADCVLQPKGTGMAGQKLSDANVGDNFFTVAKATNSAPGETGIKIYGEVGVQDGKPLGTGLMADTLTQINYTITAAA